MSDSIIVNSTSLTSGKLFGWFFGDFSFITPFIIEHLYSIFISICLIMTLRFFFLSFGCKYKKSNKVAEIICNFITFICNIRSKH